MRNLVIYHAGTGTVIGLSDEVYLIDVNAPWHEDPDDLIERLSNGEADIPPREHKGIRIDNYNMGNLFFGGAE